MAVPAAEDLWMYAAPQAGRRVLDWHQDGQAWGCDAESYVIRGIAQDASVHVSVEPIRLAVTTTPCEGGEATRRRSRPGRACDGTCGCAPGEPASRPAG